MLRALPLLAATAAVATELSATTRSCQFTQSATSFDLSPLTRAGPSQLRVTDVRDATKAYYFDICDDAPPPPGYQAACTSNGRNTGLSATAWQVDTSNVNDTLCYRLGNNVTTGWNFELFGECLEGEARTCVRRQGRPRGTRRSVLSSCPSPLVPITPPPTLSPLPQMMLTLLAAWC